MEDWYIHIDGWMFSLGLNPYELLVYAYLKGITQKGDGYFYGSIDTLAERCGIKRRATFNILKRLMENGLVTKTETIRNGVKRCTYQASAPDALGVHEMHSGSAPDAPNNKEDNKDASINTCSLSNAHARESKKSAFVAPSLEEVREYCAARGSKIDPEAFVAFYTSKGWKIGNAPMKDWKAAVITWEKREATRPSSPTPSPQKKQYTEDVYEHNLRVLDRIQGTHKADEYHAKYYPHEL